MPFPAFRCCLVFFVILLSASGFGSAYGFFWEPDVTREQLNGICEARGGVSSPGLLFVDGYYQPSGGPLFGFEEVIRRLGKGRFQFFEMDSSWVERSYTWGDFDLRQIEGEGRYTRFYLAERGDPNCRAFEEYLGSSRGLAKKKTYLRAYGIYPKHCIAAVKTDVLRSEYGIGFRRMQDPEIPEVSWAIDEVKRMSTGERYAGSSSFRYCLKGEKKNGRCRGDREDIYSCPSREKKTENFETIYYQTLKATPNPILERQLTEVDIREPSTVEVERVIPELLEVIEGKDNIPKLYGDEVLDLYQSMDAEGYAWFDYRNDIMKDGRTHNNAIPLLCIINEQKRKMLKIDITCLGPPRSRGWYDLCCIRAIPEDGIYFLAWGGRQEPREKANNFKILKYSWGGQLEKVVAGVLPFEFVTDKEHLHYYAKLKIQKGQYLFSIFDVMREDDLIPDIHPSKEYKFRITIK